MLFNCQCVAKEIGDVCTQATRAWELYLMKRMSSITVDFYFEQINLSLNTIKLLKIIEMS